VLISTSDTGEAAVVACRYDLSSISSRQCDEKSRLRCPKRVMKRHGGSVATTAGATLIPHGIAAALLTGKVCDERK
jgi:hypothetical protein